MRRILFDVEGNGLLPELTKLHCIAAVDVDTGEAKDFKYDQLREAREYLESAELLIAHYGLLYDFPALAKILDFHVPFEKQRDTVVIARLKFPDIKAFDSVRNKKLAEAGQPLMGELFGSHSIEAWGQRLGIPKLHTNITDWAEWTPEIHERCIGDVRTNLALWRHLKPETYSQQAIELEHRTARLCNMITEAGWPFDVAAAGALHGTLTEEKAKLEEALKAEFGGWYKDKGGFVPKKDNKKLGYVAGAPLTKLEWTEFNPNSTQHIERCLRKLGWNPTSFTDGGRAKLDEEVIEGLEAQFPQAAGLARYLMIDKRLGQLANGDNAWLKLVSDENRIHAQYNPMGAVTSRASHYKPNIAQVPAVKSPYGKECRALFHVPPGWEQVGADMSGLELRCLAHYMAKYDGGAYGEQVLDGDVHWVNVIAMGLLEPGTERITDETDPLYPLHTGLREDGGKRFLYAWLYGTGDEKAGKIILECCRLVKNINPEWSFVYEKFFGSDPAPSKKKLKAVGAAVKYALMQKTKGLSRLVNTIKALAEKGTLPGLDRRILPVRSEHAALNTLLQAAGAILCKRWICDSYDALIAEGLKWGWDGDFVFLGWIHDELQVACRNGLGDRIGAVLTRCAQQAGQPFDFRISLDSTYKIGNDWSSTH